MVIYKKRLEEICNELGYRVISIDGTKKGESRIFTCSEIFSPFSWQCIDHRGHLNSCIDLIEYPRDDYYWTIDNSAKITSIIPSEKYKTPGKLYFKCERYWTDKSKKDYEDKYYQTIDIDVTNEQSLILYLKRLKELINNAAKLQKEYTNEFNKNLINEDFDLELQHD